VIEAPATEPTPASASPKRPRARQIADSLVVLVIALVVSIVVRDFAFQTFYIPSGSMEPTLLPGDRVIVNKISLDLGAVHRGDVMVFKAPAEVALQCGDNDTDLVKRVIGLPGDRVSSRNDTIYINGSPLKERWPHLEPLGRAIGTEVVPKGEYFMIGDNHNNSCDSRYWGFVPRANFIGKVFVRVWPLSRLAWL
jgi:signal peptidase I